MMLSETASQIFTWLAAFFDMYFCNVDAVSITSIGVGPG